MCAPVDGLGEDGGSGGDRRHWVHVRRWRDAKFECDALARRVFTNLTHAQLASKNPKAENLPYTFQDSKTDYE